MQYIFNVFPSILEGLKMTMGIFMITIVGSLPLSILVALGLRSEYFSIRWILNVILWIIRGTPLLLQLIFMYYGLALVGIVMDRFTAAAIAFIINYVAYLAEIFRGGIQAVPKGQIQAGEMLGLSRNQIFYNITLPQLLKIVMPSLTNELVTLVKDTALVYVIGLGDILRQASIAASRDVSLVPYLLVGLVYLMLTAVCILLMRHFENKMAYY